MLDSPLISEPTQMTGSHTGSHSKDPAKLGFSHSKACVVTLVEEVDGFHTGILFIADLQLVELAKQIYQPLHDFHPILTEAEELDTNLSIML